MLNVNSLIFDDKTTKVRNPSDGRETDVNPL